jgi:hypothetical protein
MTDHRAVAVHLNNAVWKSLAAENITEASDTGDRQELLYAAYASTYHWIQVGTAANRARGEHLISRVASRVGEVDAAFRHALRCLDLVESHPELMADWDLAFALEALARAQAGLGDVAAARSTLERALEATAGVTDDGDRAVLEEELHREPWFGLERP